MNQAPMDLSTVVAVFAQIFATFLVVSYVASATTEAISSTLGWRAKLLLKDIRVLLDEANTDRDDSMTLAIYNNPVFNPRTSGDARSLAELKKYPSIVLPSAFATALMGAVDVVGNDPDVMIAEVGKRLNPKLRILAIDMIERNRDNIRNGQLEPIQREISDWFERSVAHLSDEYRKRTQLSNFLIGFALAALLGLNPLPQSLVESGLLVKFGVDQKYLGWLIVAASTLFGAPFWFSIVMKVSPIKPTGPNPKAAPPPPVGTAEGAAAVRAVAPAAPPQAP